MKISSAEVIPYALPFKEAYVTAAGALTQREMVLLRIRTEGGAVGLGEAVPLSMRGGTDVEQVVRELEALAEGDALQRTIDSDGVPAGSLKGGSEISPPARCAALTAILDLRERSVEPAEHDPAPVPCNATLVAGEPSAVAEDALRWAAEGFRTFKLKVGAGDDLAQVAAVRETLGPEPRIRLDANGAWTLERARRLLAELEPLDIELVEQPVATMEEAAELSPATKIPLAGDESIVTARDAARAQETGAFALAGVKLSKVGGIEAGLRIAAALPCFVSSALDGPVGIAASGRLAQALDRETASSRKRRLAHGLATQRLFASTVASVECELRDGLLHLPPGPGLGVEIDEEALRAHRI